MYTAKTAARLRPALYCNLFASLPIELRDKHIIYATTVAHPHPAAEGRSKKRWLPGERSCGIFCIVSSMAEKEGYREDIDSKENGQYHRDSVALGADDAGAIPKGTIDPVYEAKARVLNRAVCRTTK